MKTKSVPGHIIGVMNGLPTRRLAFKHIIFAHYNPRSIAPGNAKKLSNSITRLGLLQPPVWNVRSFRLVAGHQRLKTRQYAPDDLIDVIQVDLNDADEKLANVLLNDPNLCGVYVPDQLAQVVAAIHQTDIEDFDLSDLVKDINIDIDDILDGEEESEDDDESDVADADDEEEVVEEGSTYRKITLAFDEEKYDEVVGKLSDLQTNLNLPSREAVLEFLIEFYNHNKT